MQQDMLEGIESLNRSTLESVKRLGEINARALERLAQHQLNVASAFLSGNVKQFQLLGEADKVQDVVAAQSKMVAELNEHLVAHAKRTVEILLETKDEFVSWVEDGMKAASKSPLGKTSSEKSE